MNVWVSALIAFGLSLDSAADSRVRRIEVRGDQIVTVKTSMGIATIIQVPDRPNSVVVGDQAAFKVEYLDRAITIKPLNAKAKSNLYVYTDWRRFNVQLVTGAQASADYVVYLENERKPEKAEVSWSPLRRILKNGNITFETLRIGHAAGQLLGHSPGQLLSHSPGHAKMGPVLIEFEIRSSKKERVNPEWLWLTQRGVTKPIHSLFLSGIDLTPSEGVHGTIQVLLSDIDPSENIQIEFRRKQISLLTIPKVNAWK